MYMRLSKVVIQHGTKRPEVFLFQELANICGGLNGSSILVDGIAGDEVRSFIGNFQSDNGLGVDYKAGKNTWSEMFRKAKIIEDISDHFSLKRRIQSLICLYETGHRKDAYGFAEDDIGDGAGANYGVVQHNACGSMKTLLRIAGRDDLLSIYNSHDRSKVVDEIADWVGSTEGIKAQDKYFDKVVYRIALDEFEALGLERIDENHKMPDSNIFTEKVFALLCDSVVQNGGLFSNRRPPFQEWSNLSSGQKKKKDYIELVEGNEWNRFLGNSLTDSAVYIGGGTSLKMDIFKFAFKRVLRKYKDRKEKSPMRETNRAMIIDLIPELKTEEDVLTLLAQWRARTSSPRWWRGVEKRRMLYVKEKNIIHGERVDLLHDYGIGIDTVPFAKKVEEEKEDEFLEFVR